MCIAPPRKRKGVMLTNTTPIRRATLTKPPQRGLDPDLQIMADDWSLRQGQRSGCPLSPITVTLPVEDRAYCRSVHPKSSRHLSTSDLISDRPDPRYLFFSERASSCRVSPSSKAICLVLLRRGPAKVFPIAADRIVAAMSRLIATTRRGAMFPFTHMTVHVKALSPDLRISIAIRFGIGPLDAFISILLKSGLNEMRYLRMGHKVTVKWIM